VVGDDALDAGGDRGGVGDVERADVQLDVRRARGRPQWTVLRHVAQGGHDSEPGTRSPDRGGQADAGRAARDEHGAGVIHDHNCATAPP